MQMKATTSEFVEMFTTMRMSGMFNPIVLSVKGHVISMVGRDESDTTLTSQKYKGIKIEDGVDTKIVFDPDEMLNAFKFFKSDEEISVVIGGNTIVIANADETEINAVLEVPQIDIETVEQPEFPFKIVKGLPVITNKATGKKIEYTINATIPVKYLAEFVKGSNFVGVNPRIYELNIEDNKLRCTVGLKTDFQKSITTTVNVTSEGSGKLLFGSGFEEMISTLSGTVTMYANPGVPAWFVSKSDKNIVYALIAPALDIED